MLCKLHSFFVSVFNKIQAKSFFKFSFQIKFIVKEGFGKIVKSHSHTVTCIYIILDLLYYIYVIVVLDQFRKIFIYYGGNQLDDQ